MAKERTRARTPDPTESVSLQHSRYRQGDKESSRNIENTFEERKIKELIPIVSKYYTR